MKKLMVGLFLILVSAQAQAAQTIKGEPACFTKEDFSDLQMMAYKKDLTGFTYMMTSSKCVLFKDSFQASILDHVENEIKIRVYFGNNAAVLWTANDSVHE